MIQALIFDFDGLILDTETPEYAAWSEVYAAHGCELPRDLWTNAIGRGKDQSAFDPYGALETLLGCPVDQDVIRVQRRARYLSLIEDEPVRPGVLSYLTDARAQGLRLAVASSSDRAWVEGHLARLGLLPFFDLTRCADDVSRTKPDPELYLSAVAGLDVPPERAVAFEDSPNGARAAKAAGLFCVAVPNPMTANLSFGHADFVLPSMAARPLADVLALACAAIATPPPSPEPVRG